jgi:hypothetical protein
MKLKLKPLAAMLALVGTFFVALGIPMAVAQPADVCASFSASWEPAAEKNQIIRSCRDSD